MMPLFPPSSRQRAAQSAPYHFRDAVAHLTTAGGADERHPAIAQQPLSDRRASAYDQRKNACPTILFKDALTQLLNR